MDKTADNREADLVARAKAGDGEALAALVERLQGPVFRFAQGMCKNREDAQEVLQETLLAAVRSLDSYRGEARLATWAYAIAQRHCLKLRNQDHGRQVGLESAATLQADQISQEEQLRDRELLAALDSALYVLSPENRAVLLLRDVEGLSAKETAQTLGLSISQMKSRLHRARVTLREYLLPTLVQSQPIEGESKPGCPDVVHMFSRYLEDEIGPDLCQEMQEHIGDCDYCRTTCDSLKRTISVCQAVPKPEVPRAVQSALRHEIRRHLGAS